MNPAERMATAVRYTIMHPNESDTRNVFQVATGRRIAYDPLRNETIWVNTRERKAAYDWIGGNVYNWGYKAGFRICANNNSWCATIYNGTEVTEGPFQWLISSFAVDPLGG